MYAEIDLQINTYVLTAGNSLSLLESRWNLTRFFNGSNELISMEDSLLVDMVRFCKFPIPSKPDGEIPVILFWFRFRVMSFGTFWNALSLISLILFEFKFNASRFLRSLFEMVNTDSKRLWLRSNLDKDFSCWKLLVLTEFSSFFERSLYG